MNKKNYVAAVLVFIMIFLLGCSVPADGFDAMHSLVDKKEGKYLILGNVPVNTNGAPEGLSGIPGRWEGYDKSMPVRNDTKFVLAIQKISGSSAEGKMYYGSNLQFPAETLAVNFQVNKGDKPSLTAEIPLARQLWMTGDKVKLTLAYDKEKNSLTGGMSNMDSTQLDREIVLTKDNSFYVYKDYTKYLESKRIYSKKYKDSALNTYGAGYMLYLPKGSEDDPNKSWPLIFFLHGTGDRGENMLLLPKASPFMMIREKSDLPCIIAAPILNTSDNYRSFPMAYMEGVLKELTSSYHVDEKRVYLTGLSMGGEATYRFALEHPEKFAAIASLSGFLAKYEPAFSKEAAEMQSTPLENLKGMPAREIHGADDVIVSADMANNTMRDFKNAGVNIDIKVLEGRDHDTWTDTYLDPAFYEWLLQQKKD